MSTLHDIELVPASVDVGATFADAARALSEYRIPAIAVLDGGRVVGFFTEDDLLRGIFPEYLAELHHTAFVETEPPSVEQRAQDVREQPVRAHMRKPLTIDHDAGTLHAAERFVHCDEGALAVVEPDGTFAGMLAQMEFAYAMLRRMTEPQSS